MCEFPPILVSDPDEVAARGREMARAHWAWRDRVAPRLQAGDPVLAATLSQTLAEVDAAIDCASCGRCCRHMGPVVEADEATSLAGALDLSPAQFRDHYLRPMWPAAADAEQIWLLPAPCPLHDGLLCTVYEARPQPCRDFPGQAGQTPAGHLTQLVEFARLCPIAFNTVERLRRLPQRP